MILIAIIGLFMLTQAICVSIDDWVEKWVTKKNLVIENFFYKTLRIVASFLFIFGFATPWLTILSIILLLLSHWLRKITLEHNYYN